VAACQWNRTKSAKPLAAETICGLGDCQGLRQASTWTSAERPQFAALSGLRSNHAGWRRAWRHIEHATSCRDQGPIAFTWGHERAADELSEGRQHDLSLAHHKARRAKRIPPGSVQANDGMEMARERERPRAISAVDRVMPALCASEHGRCLNA
jgi:hypothetical protein